MIQILVTVVVKISPPINTGVGTGGPQGPGPTLSQDRRQVLFNRFVYIGDNFLLKLARDFNIKFGTWTTSSFLRVPNYIM